MGEDRKGGGQDEEGSPELPFCSSDFFCLPSVFPPCSLFVLSPPCQVRNVIVTGLLFSAPVLAVFAFNNTVAIVYGSSQALPFGTILVIVLIWLLLTFPLTVGGQEERLYSGQRTRIDREGWCWTGTQLKG